MAYIDWKFAAKPLQLRRVGDQPADSTNMCLLDIDCFAPQPVDDQEILGEHIRTLVIFRGDILRNGIVEGDGVRPPKWDLEDITVSELADSREG